MQASVSDYVLTYFYHSETVVSHLNVLRPDHCQVQVCYTAHFTENEQVKITEEYQQTFHWTVRNGTVKLFCLASIMHFCFQLLIRYLFSNAKQ
jgi:hypothetical protein